MRYWPKYIPGGLIQQNFEDLDAGSAVALGGMLDGIPSQFLCMKDDEYYASLISSNGTNDGVGADKQRYVDGKKVVFKNPEAVSNHY
jgi:hypothetical protein